MRDMFDEFMEELRRRSEQRQQGDAPQGENKPAEDEAGDGRSNSQDDEEPEEPREPPRPVFGGRGGRPPFERRRVVTSGGPPSFGRIWLFIVVLFVVLPFVGGIVTLGIGLWTDAIWYGSVGYSGVFWTRFWSQIGFFAIAAAIAMAMLLLNVWIAGRLMPWGETRRISFDDLGERLFERFTPDRYGRSYTGAGEGLSGAIDVADVARPARWILLGIAIVVALLLGAAIANGWSTVQLWLHQVSFASANPAFKDGDPVFHRDIGFFVFELPFLRLVQSYVNNLLLIAFALAAVRYLLSALSGASMPTAARLHLGLLFGLFLFSVAFGYQLDKFELVYSNQGVATGVSYTDANARFFALDALSIIAALAGAFVIGLAVTRWRWPLAATVVVWGLAYISLAGIYPQVVQRLVVVPNEQNQEAPYITYNLKQTKLAFGLQDWTTTAYDPQTSVDKAALDAEPATLQNVRLWDYRPLETTLDQLQIIRQYYNFNDVDTDRYTFTDPATCAPNPPPCVRQVMLAGRELEYSKLDQSWVNQHVTYTHGIGLAMVPVNEVTTGGQPRLLISNLPPTSVPGAPVVKRPQIYFGTQLSQYVVVDAASPEFDYPASTGQGSDTLTSWTGQTGIKLDNALLRLLFSARFGDLNMLISNQITGSSQLLFHQSIFERVGLVAPFLQYDKDPYLVVTADGRLVYILDAFTTTTAFPNAQSYDPSQEPTTSGLSGSFNYIRNSVKVVMDAYDGTMTFYVADPKDPLIQAYSGVFPGLFRPIADMPSDIRAHVRYPEDLFDAQTTMYEQYHVTDPGVYYQRNDIWQAARTSDGSQSASPRQERLEAYYFEMRMPGQQNPEFLLLQPMVPQSRPNMISWVAARNDQANYGEVRVFDFPRNSSIIGPQQMQALFLQTSEISAQITLWSQQGSIVILGNLLVVPLQNSILYIEPVYLEASSNGLPVFQKVIVATPTQIVWGNSLQEAVSLILAGKGVTPGASQSPGPTATSTPGPSASAGPTGTSVPGTSLPPNATVQQILAEADRHFQLAQQALQAKDLGTYQKEMDIVGQLLQQAQQVAGTPAP